MTQTREISFSVGARKFSGYAAIAAGGGPGVVVLHAWWGLTPFFKQVCDRLAEAGFTAFAPDLYGGKIARTVADAERLMDASDDEYIRAAAFAAIEEVKRLPGVNPSRLGLIGFSMGAAWSLVLSAHVPDEIEAAVLFYGTYPIDLGRARASIQGHFAQDDPWEPEEGIRMMEADLHAAGRDYTFHFYPGAGHWFMEEDREDAFNRDAADLAWSRTLEFLRDKLAPPAAA